MQSPGELACCSVWGPCCSQVVRIAMSVVGGVMWLLEVRQGQSEAPSRKRSAQRGRAERRWGVKPP